MANVYYPNVDVAATDNGFTFVWKLTRALKKAGWTYLASGDGTSKDTTGVATSDLWGGNADPSNDTYPTALNTVAAWWLAQGAATVKVPVNSNSTGTFLRGEKVTQATSLAEGELLGFMYDSATPSNSYLNILVRTGTFNGSDVVTGASSGATITATSTPTIYVSEVLFWKATNTTSGSVYGARVSAAEASFVDLIGAAGCTATIAPGGGGTGNSFPTLGYTVRGAGGAATHIAWFNVSSLGTPKAQITATNVTGAANVSPDGTFWLVVGVPSAISATSSGNTGWGFFRVDSIEEGDLDPFVWFAAGAVASRTSVTLGMTDAWSSTNQSWSTISAGLWVGWRRRGFASADAVATYMMSALNYYTVFGNGMLLLLQQNSYENVACHTQTQRVREPVWLCTVNTATKHRKGIVRWLSYTPTGIGYQTWTGEGTTWIQLSTPQSSQYFGILIGPWDAAYSPLQA